MTTKTTDELEYDAILAKWGAKAKTTVWCPRCHARKGVSSQYCDRCEKAHRGPQAQTSKPNLPDQPPTGEEYKPSKPSRGGRLMDAIFKVGIYGTMTFLWGKLIFLGLFVFVLFPLAVVGYAIYLYPIFLIPLGLVLALIGYVYSRSNKRLALPDSLQITDIARVLEGSRSRIPMPFKWENQARWERTEPWYELNNGEWIYQDGSPVLNRQILRVRDSHPPEPDEFEARTSFSELWRNPPPSPD